MNSPIRKIGLLILAILILPVLVFSVFEIGNLRQNEKVIQDIYTNQLDAILFSINQYSDDMISNLAGRVENAMNTTNGRETLALTTLIEEMPSVKGLVQFDETMNLLDSIIVPGNNVILVSDIKARLAENDSILTRLKTYLRGGYRKNEPLASENSHFQWIVFLVKAGDKSVINALAIDPEIFVHQTLDPKIQAVAQNKFYIVAFLKGQKQPFYNSDKQYKSGVIANRKPFWLLKNYQMGIELKDMTISDMARMRMRKNLLLIALIDVMLLAGAWLIFKNIRKQIEFSQMKSDFVSSVSHEIRTPLALISMYIETLEMGRISSKEKVNEYYSIILSETSRLSGIVNRILSFSQIENNKRKYALTDTNLNDVVEKAAATFRFTLENKGFSYTWIPDPHLPLIPVDREAVTDALMNLIDNAIKYSITNKEITVRTGVEDHYAYVEVEDRGVGISEKNQKYVFDKFFRVTEKDLANRVKGSGLGLSIVKHIIEAHKGKIVLKSIPDSGSRFRLLFPFR